MPVDLRTTPSTATPLPPTSLRQAWVALVGLSAVFLFEMLDNSVLTVALPTIGCELAATTTELQWVTAAYAVVFGGLMLAFGALADRFGRRRLMLTGLALLATTSLATALVTTAWQLIAVRAALGVAAAMTTPGSMALAFRLFRDDALRVRATTLISTVGLVGLAIGPTLGGLVIAVAPWQVLLLVNAPIAVLALVGVRAGIAPDDPAELHRAPVDVLGALLGTATVVLALVTPTLAVDAGGWTPWATGLTAVAAALGFAHRQRTAAHPLLDPALLARPLVASGLAYKAAAGMATAGLGYLVALQLQLDWGWSPAQAALGTLPQVVVLLAGGAFVQPLLRRLGFDRAAWLGAAAVAAGLAEYALLGRLGYPWVALALVLVALGLRVVGVVAAMNVLRGLPENRTTIGAALTDTASEVTSAVGLAVVGTSLALLFGADLTAPGWTPDRAAHFHQAVTVAALALTALAAALVGWGLRRSRAARA
nr:MFS transporter [Actinosynnema pretiosum]